MDHASRVLVEQLITLLAHRDANAFARGFLAAVLAHHNAQAGSLLVVQPEVLHVRQGVFSPIRADAVNRWEDSVSQRLAAGPWVLDGGSPPALTARPLPALGEVMLAAPLVDGTGVVGGVAFVFSEGRHTASLRSPGLTSLIAFVGRAIPLLLECELMRGRLSHFGLLHQVGQAMGSTHSTQQLVEYALQLATSVTDARTAMLLLLDEEAGDLVTRFDYDDQGVLLPRDRVPVGTGIAGWVAMQGVAHVANDLQLDSRYDPRVDACTGLDTRSVLCVPLLIRDRVIGVLEVFNKRSGQGFDEDDLHLLSTIASQAAIAVENARLFSGLRAQRERVIHAQEEVRKEVARNLHDGVVQHLSAIAMGLDHVELLLDDRPEAALRELQHLRRQVQLATQQARLALFELRPLILETRGLVAALSSYLDKLEMPDGLAVHFEAAAPDLELDLRTAQAVFSIVQESISNVKKHARAANLWVELKKAENLLRVEIGDDGLGFDLAGVEREYHSRGSIGLHSMRERAELIDARLDIDTCTRPGGRGTVVRLVVPLGRDET